jgi:L-lactate dehydrogenase complex protein LldF
MSGHGLVTPGNDFRERTAHAVADPALQHALRNLDRRLRTASDVARAHPDWKERAAAIRRETLADLDGWLDRLERSLTADGVQVHRAASAADACAIVVAIGRERGARTVVKSKSMATEEIDLGDALERAGMRAIETDLGEYIVQLAGERPSHMITPAIHKTLPQIRDVLAAAAGHDLAVDREQLTAWARARLRAEFLRADLGVTGVNFAAADTGTLVLVTNEGNGRYCTTVPRVHVAVMPIEKVIPRLADVAVLLPLLTSHATGQPLSNYVTMLTGPRRDGETDGPDELHVVFLDNRRRTLLGTQYEEMLACIRCGACLNVCPVYRHVSGHAYDAVYSGPMGKVLTPLLSDGKTGSDLPFGSTLCHACDDACPVLIPLSQMIVHLRADARPTLRRWRWWARAWSTPAGYSATTALARLGAWLVPRQWRPAKESFRARWRKAQR